MTAGRKVPALWQMAWPAELGATNPGVIRGSVDWDHAGRWAGSPHDVSFRRIGRGDIERKFLMREFDVKDVEFVLLPLHRLFGRTHYPAPPDPNNRRIPGARAQNPASRSAATRPFPANSLAPQRPVRIRPVPFAAGTARPPRFRAAPRIALLGGSGERKPNRDGGDGKCRAKRFLKGETRPGRHGRTPFPRPVILRPQSPACNAVAANISYSGGQRGGKMKEIEAAFIPRITLYPSDKGGRKIQSSRVGTGQTKDLEIVFLSPEIAPAFRAVQKFYLWEGWIIEEAISRF